MIPSAKLSDFTTKELAMLLLAVEDKIKNCLSSLETLSRFDDSEFKQEQEKFWNGQLDVYRLWQVQIMNAAVEVKWTDTAKYN